MQQMVPTPMALCRVHLFWFRSGHAQVGVTAPFATSKVIRGAAPTTACLKSVSKSIIPIQGAPRSVCLSVTTNQGAWALT